MKNMPIIMSKDKGYYERNETKIRQEIIDYLKSRIESVNNCYKKEIEKYYDESIKSLNVSNLSKREKDELINKRNCLLVQRQCYKEILELVEDK